MRNIDGHLGSNLPSNSKYRRIVSVVPSQTELLYDLGLTDEVVGITKFCIHPKEWFKSKLKVGGTKTLNLKLIEELNPDLIIANKEENTKEQIIELSEKFPMWVSDIKNLEESFSMIKSISRICNKTENGENLVLKIQHARAKYKLGLAENLFEKSRVLYLIWNGPYMAAGKDTFINDMINEFGLQNILTEDSRYPNISANLLKELNPEIIFLSSEPFPFKEKHKIEIQKIIPTAKIIIVDGEMFSWYGSRLLKSYSYFEELKKELFY